MARRVARGEVWMCRFKPPDKRRPVLILSRNDAIRVLGTVIVAPITSTIRGLPSEVLLDTAHGMKHRCAVNLDHVQTVRQQELKRLVSTLPPQVMQYVCRALARATACD